MIVAIVACHDRRALTERALSSLMRSAEAAGRQLRVVLFDDGSTDGTAEAARALMPEGALRVITGSGSDFWAKGMAAAEREALADAADTDHLLWLNDDVTLDVDAVPMLLATVGTRTDRIAVGATTDPATGAVNYGGYVRSGAHPLRFRHLELADPPRPVDTFNGNSVLVPVPAARRIGGIEGTYSHGLADIDYGLRANATGVVPLLAPRAVGTCPSHPPRPRRPVLEEWRAFRSVKGGGHPASMQRVLRRLRPRTWPVFFAWSYTTWWIRAVRGSVRR